MDFIRRSFFQFSLSLVISFLFFHSIGRSQPWTDSFPKDRVSKTNLTLKDYQNAFYNYWEPFNVKSGYYFETGEKKKAYGWMPFKRWEWFWESRVNPKTTAFPRTSAYEQFKNYSSQRGVTDNPSGNWTCMGPFNNSTLDYNNIGRLNHIAFDPGNANHIYVSAASGGIWKTTDGGTSWVALGDENAALGASNIVLVTSAANDILYLATGDGDGSDTYSVGVLKSTNGGITWNTTGLAWTQSQQFLIYRLIIDPNNSNILYAATNDGLYKTSDAATTWSKISTINFEDLEFKPGSSTTIYGSTDDGKIYRSTDSGANWLLKVSESQGRRTMLAVTEDNPSRVYAVMADENNQGLLGVFRSYDSGNTFSMIFAGTTSNLLGSYCDGSGTGGQAYYDLAIAADPTDASIIYLGGIKTWKSTTSGSTWSCSDGNHPDKHYLAFQNSSSTIFECNDGGLCKSVDGGATWTDLSNMAIAQMYRLGVAQTVNDEAIAGHQDVGTKTYNSGVWDDVLGYDGLECIIDFEDEDVQYGSGQKNQIYRTYDHWATSTKISNAITGNNLFLTPYKMDPNNHLTLFVANQNLWKSTNQGNTWTKLTTWNGNFIREFAIAPSNSQCMYLVSWYDVFKTTDGGASWTTVTSNLPINNNVLVNVAIKDDDPNTAWVTYSGYDSDRVYQTTNGGTSWTNISGGLPELPVNCVIQDKQKTDNVVIYVGTDVGVYVKIDNDDWMPFFDGLPNVVVSELDIYYDENNSENSKIRAATFGRGMWESDLWSYYITVDSPNGGEDWQRKTTHTIKWSSNIAGYVVIRLYKYHFYHATISNLTLNDGTYRWTIPEDLQLNANYQIRVNSSENSSVTDMSDSYFEVSECTIPDNTTVQDIYLFKNQSDCYDALNEVTVAGSGTYFKVASNGEAEFIAGSKVSLKDGVRAYSGSHLHAHITLEANYCESQPPIVANPDTIFDVAEIITDVESNVSIYPNPGTGRFTIDFMDKATTAEITLFDLQGNLLVELNCVQQLKQEMDISHLQMGMYIIAIKTPEKVTTSKVIIN